MGHLNSFVGCIGNIKFCFKASFAFLLTDFQKEGDSLFHFKYFLCMFTDYSVNYKLIIKFLYIRKDRVVLLPSGYGDRNPRKSRESKIYRHVLCFLYIF